MKKLSHQELVDRQENRRGFAIPLTVVLNHVRSLYNVGSIFRTADGAGIEKIWLCGITGKPPDSKIAKTALGAQDVVEWEHSWEIIPVLKKLKSAGYQIVLLEQLKESVPYETFKPTFPCCLVLGNEIDGVSEDLLSLCDAAIEIDMAGLKNSLNVTVAFGIVAYHMRNCVLASLRGTKTGCERTEANPGQRLLRPHLEPLPRNDTGD